MKKEEAERVLEDLLEEIQEEAKRNVRSNQEVKEELFREVQKNIRTLYDELDSNVGRLLEEEDEYVSRERDNAVQRDEDFLVEMKRSVGKLMERYEEQDISEEDIRLLSSRILQTVQDRLYEKETKQIRNSNRTPGNDYFQDFQEQVEPYMQKLKNYVMERNESLYYDGLNSVFKNITNVLEQLNEYERSSQEKMLETVEACIGEFKKEFEKQEEKAAEESMKEIHTKTMEEPLGVLDRNPSDKPFQELNLEPTDDLKRVMRERYLDGDFSVTLVDGIPYVVVKEPEINEQGKITSRGILYTGEAFEAMYMRKENEKDPRLVIVAGEYAMSCMTQQEHDELLERDEEHLQPEITEKDNKSPIIESVNPVESKEETKETQPKKEKEDIEPSREESNRRYRRPSDAYQRALKASKGKDDDEIDF